MSDLIIRKAAIDAIKDAVIKDEQQYAEDALKALPSAQPEQDREFIKLTVRNSNGRPYYSIIYLEFDDNGVGHDFEGYSSYSLDVISDYLKKYFMPSTQPEQRWIPWSSGKLPEESGTYTVTAYDGVTKRVTYAKYQKRLKRWELTGARAYWKVLAWMPLQEPYREERTEE